MRSLRVAGSALAAVVAALVMIVVGTSPASAATLGLTGLPTGTYTDGQNFGPWNVVFAGYGSVSATAKSMTLAPKAATSPDATHAALVVSTTEFTANKLTLTASMTTTKQLRTGSAPNAWEVGWLVWDYTDNEHFMYAIAKPNGWELGKRDPAYPGGQRFLATGSNVKVPVGSKANYSVTRTVGANGTSTTVLKIQGVTVAKFTDTERAYTSGAVGLYTEDAAIKVTTVKANG